MIDKLDERYWYVLWAPLNFGETEQRDIDITNVLKIFDSAVEVWNPKFSEVYNGKERIVPLFKSYRFIRCVWSPHMEPTLLEKIPVRTMFLRDKESPYPYRVIDDDIKNTKLVVNDIFENPNSFTQRHFDIGRMVRILNKLFFEQVGKVTELLPNGRISVDVGLFNRGTTVAFEPKELEVIT